MVDDKVIRTVPGLFGDVELVEPAEKPAKRVADMTYAERIAHERELRRARDKRRTQAGNPMIAECGAGPAGATCGTCAHLVVKHYAGTYFKCGMRKDTNGPTTDVRKRWPACAKYEERIERDAV